MCIYFFCVFFFLLSFFFCSRQCSSALFFPFVPLLSLLCPAFLFLKAGAETDQDDRCWSFCAQPMVAASGDSETDRPRRFWSLFVFSPSADAFSRDDEDDGDEGVLCWWSCRSCLCVFPCFRQCPSYGFLCLASLSFLLVFLFSFFSVLSILFCFSLFFLGQQPVLLYSLYMALFRKQILH